MSDFNVYGFSFVTRCGFFSGCGFFHLLDNKELRNVRGGCIIRHSFSMAERVVGCSLYLFYIGDIHYVIKR